ncbi:DUF397 domain-containing protein [Streptomyces sp. F63]|uniref:DUF397 domain-containing protein n=1 Tax=Streptomyces sp. F63 TaxID=2824887 RepID=UPI001B3796BD|nr:DUF397 domain-containing protein [Streptomyces sp. F63]MBQ0986928.1 DUF397 domain-containing protein [Streptomyces sp. F63]
MSAEKSTEPIGTPIWRKSSYSGSGGGQCVEVAVGPGAVRVRDSKDRRGPVLAVAADEWSAFVEFAARR